VRPLGIFSWGDAWSVAAWCELRQDFRNFRLDRIAGLRRLEERFADESASASRFPAQDGGALT